jgi:hypothetical protein
VSGGVCVTNLPGRVRDVVCVLLEKHVIDEGNDQNYGNDTSKLCQVIKHASSVKVSVVRKMCTLLRLLYVFRQRLLTKPGTKKKQRGRPTFSCRSATCGNKN